MEKLYIFCTFAVLLSVCQGDNTPSFASSCFNITGSISMNITFKASDGKLKSTVVAITEAATLSKSNCNQTAGPVMGVISEGGNDLTLQFDINANKTKLATMDPEHWGVSKITYDYTINEAEAEDKSRRQATADGSFFVTPVNKTYSCSKQSVKLENVTIAQGNETVKVADEFVNIDETGLTIQFGSTSPDSDYDYHYCKTDQKVKDIVPIAVGVALAALVVIVLVAYLIGRRRTVASGGYERV